MGNVTSWVAQCFYPEDQVFWAAARYGDPSVIRSATSRLTPETRKYLEWQEPCSGRTALLEAAAKGHCECAQLLVEAGADCNAKDLKLNTPLHLACRRAKPEMVKMLLEAASVLPFEINMHMKTPLDVARSRFSEEEDNPDPYADGWLYEKTDNVVSLVSGISSLNSWTRRFCIVLERGDPNVLELALFSMQAGGGVRPVCPASVVLYNVAAGMESTNDSKWFNRKEFTFLLRGAQLDKCHYRATSALQNPVDFAALDQAGYEAWASFFAHQRLQLRERTPPARSLQELLRPFASRPHSHIEGWTPSEQSVAPAASFSTISAGIGPDEDEDIRRAIELSLQTAAANDHEPGATEMALSPPLPVSAPNWEDWEGCASADTALLSPGHDAARNTSEQGSDSAASSSSEHRPPPVVNYGSAPAYSSIGECVICFDGPQAAVCVPCGHNAVCMTCAEEILATTAECPVCRTHIRELIKLYRV
ncbi:hypothetical protein BBJ28_00001512 [Nothophytophthora sp. Chile5]|nr:hypothetical protein BBJ28_00001512 [Nothophytophthora sp. Chile5]